MFHWPTGMAVHLQGGSHIFVYHHQRMAKAHTTQCVLILAVVLSTRLRKRVETTTSRLCTRHQCDEMHCLRMHRHHYTAQQICMAPSNTEAVWLSTAAIYYCRRSTPRLHPQAHLTCDIVVTSFMRAASRQMSAIAML